MEKLRRWICSALALGLLAVPALILGHLALTDIRHGEENLVLEWTILRVSGFILVAFVGFALITLYRVHRVLRGRDGKRASP